MFRMENKNLKVGGMNFNRLTTIFFDLDGTLLDTAPDLSVALNTLLTQEGYSPVPYEKVRAAISDGSKALLALGFNIDEQHASYPYYREAFLQLYKQHLSTKTLLFPGMEKVLQEIEAAGINWGVVTSKPSDLARALLEDLNLAKRCACIVGGDCTTRTKPYPDPLLLACKLTKTEPKECAYIGDAEKDIEAAKYAGMRSIAALYGYLQANATPECWQADYYVDQPSDILYWIKKQRSYSVQD